MESIDLHVHSNASDGTLSPTEVVTHGQKCGLSAIALTDHDTVAGITEAIIASEHTSLEVIPGIELSCNYLNTELHILGFFVDHKDELLINKLSELKKKRYSRNEQLLERFNAAGFDITMERLFAGNKNTVITRAHFARALYEQGYVKSKGDAFKKYLDSGCPFYIPKPKVSPDDAISIIKSAKGIPVLAHPLLYKLGYNQISKLLSELTPYGLRGMEVYHSSNNIFESAKLKEIAQHNNLLITGGSDFHGSNKPDIELGKGRGKLFIPIDLLNTLKKEVSHGTNV